MRDCNSEEIKGYAKDGNLDAALMLHDLLAVLKIDGVTKEHLIAEIEEVWPKIKVFRSGGRA